MLSICAMASLSSGAVFGIQPVQLVDGSAKLLPVAVTNGRTMDMEHADLNGDGKRDIVLAVEFDQNAVLLDVDGRYVYSRDALPQGIFGDSEDIAIADLDGDGDPDLVFASEDTQTNEMYLNDGQGRFEDVSTRLPVAGTSNSFAAFDADADGDIDLLFGNIGQNQLILNGGNATFVIAAGAIPEANDATQDIELGDIDGDGDLDIILANEDANRVLRNAGDGTFADITEESIGSRTSEETREADLADVDGDGDLDLYFANVGWAGHDPQDALLVNDGTGVFTQAPKVALPSFEEFSLDVDFADLDGDGDLDAVVARLAPGLARPITILLNDGNGGFESANHLIPSSAQGNAIDVELADFNRDGRVDIYVANHVPFDCLLLAEPSL
ncbi:MAG: VCBS repeat-containing protein [Planctomycetota bacterium]